MSVIFPNIFHLSSNHATPYDLKIELSRTMSVSVSLSLCLPRVWMHRDNNFSRRRYADTNFGDHELRDGIAKK